MPFATEPKERPCGHGPRLPRRRRGRAARPGSRVDGLPRAPDRELHGRALPRRHREHSRGASSRPRRRCAIASRIARRRRRRRRVRAPARGGALRAGHAGARLQDKTATSDGLVRFTAPSVVFRRGEEIGRCRRLAAAARLRHAPRELRSRPRARPAAGVARATARVLSRRPDDRRGRPAARRGTRSGA